MLKGESAVLRTFTRKPIQNKSEKRGHKRGLGRLAGVNRGGGKIYVNTHQKGWAGKGGGKKSKAGGVGGKRREEKNVLAEGRGLLREERDFPFGKKGKYIPIGMGAQEETGGVSFS